MRFDELVYLIPFLQILEAIEELYLLYGCLCQEDLDSCVGDLENPVGFNDTLHGKALWVVVHQEREKGGRELQVLVRSGGALPV